MSPSGPSLKPASKIALPLVGVHEGRPRVGPETIHIDITNGCNTNCITCWDHSPLLLVPRDTVWKRKRVEVREVESLLEDASKLGGLRAVILSGMGEPFTHPDIDALIALVKGRGLHLTIITNLVMASAERLLEQGVDELLIGVHGATEASYLAFHPSFRSAEWIKLRTMLRQFSEAQRRFKHVQVICGTNATEVPAMVDFAAQNAGSRVNFKLASLKRGTESSAMTGPQKEWLLGEGIARAMDRSAELGIPTNLDVFEQQLRTGGRSTAPMREIGCFVGYTYARVLVDGTVLYCCNTETKVGHLAEAPFSELWQGAAWQAFRDRMRRGDYLASCFQCGKVNQNVALRNKFERAYGATRAREVTGSLDPAGSLEAVGAGE